ncbi:MAG: SRPBCC family protein [Rufibacter sp.]
MNPTPIIVEKALNAPAEKVWQAISDRDQMAEWYFDLAEFKPEVGFEFEFTGGTEENSYLHLCEVTEVEPGRKLTYSWRYDGYEGISYVTFELFPEGERTKLVLTHAGVETFPESNPDFARTNFEAGWADIIGNYLPEYVEKQTERLK